MENNSKPLKVELLEMENNVIMGRVEAFGSKMKITPNNDQKKNDFNFFSAQFYGCLLFD